MVDVLPTVLATDDESVELGGKAVKRCKTVVSLHCIKKAVRKRVTVAFWRTKLQFFRHIYADDGGIYVICGFGGCFCVYVYRLP